MSGTGPATIEGTPVGQTTLTAVEQQQIIDGNAAGTPTAGGNGGQSLGYGPPSPSTPTMTVTNGVEAALLKLKEKATEESVQREFNRQLQLQQNYNNTEAQTFWEGNIYNLGGIRVFGVMKEGSPYVQCLWGVGKYTDEDIAGDVGEGVLGFLGNRNRFGDTPPMVALPKDNSYKWKKIKGMWDVTEFTQHFGNDASRLRLRTPPPEATEEKLLPRLIYLPYELGVFVAAKPRTCHELYVEASRLAGDTSSFIQMEHIELIKDWCLGAAYKATEGSSVLALKMQPVASSTEAFIEFRENKCNWFLGSRNQAQGGQQDVTGQFEQRIEKMASTILEKALETNVEMATRLQAAQQSGTTTGGNGGQAMSTLLSGVKPLEGAELYAVMGFCGVTDPNLIPPIWKTHYHSTATLLTKRQEIDEQLQKWSVDTGYAINKVIALSKDWFADVKAVDLAKGEARASFGSLDRGFSAQCALAVTLGYLSSMKERERAEEDTAHTRTLAERLNLSKADPRPPPVTLEDFKKGVATYAGLTFIHFGTGCDLYVQLMDILHTLYCDGVEHVKDCYHPKLVMEYWFEILDKSRMYFYTMLRKSDFDKLGGPTYPTCTLSSLLQPILAGRGVENIAFPVKWRNALSTAKPTGIIHGLGGTQSSGASVSFGTNTYVGNNVKGYEAATKKQARPTTPPSSSGGTWTWQTSFPSAPPDTNTPPSFGTGDKLAHCHPTVRQQFAEYHKMYGGLPRLQLLCKHSKIKIADLLMQNSFRNPDGSNNMCFNHVLGICTNPNCRRVHPRYTDLISDYVRDLCRQLKKGMDFMLQNPDSGAKRSSSQG